MRGQNIQMVVGGYTDTDEYSKKIWDKMASALTVCGQLDHVKLPGMMPTLYMDMYKHGDIALIPLEQSDWHGCKSNLKLLEAAAKEIPCIVSNVEPYNCDYDCPALFVNSQKDWARYLTLLINDKNLIYEYGKALKAWAATSYNYESINHQRFNIFTNLCQA
jgi:glycosyltransferase involved in cell wall biosynthesis